MQARPYAEPQFIAPLSVPSRVRLGRWLEVRRESAQCEPALRDRAVRLVLTGPGGGTWDVTVGGSPPATASVAIVTDAVGFCRLAANRIASADLDVSVTGDPG